MRSRAGYEKIPVSDTYKKPGSSEYKLEDARFDQIPPEVPKGAIALAIFLMLFGMTSFVLAWLHITQEILGKPQAEIGFTVLGLMTFVPGYYHTRIAYYCWKGVPGFRWDSIPSY